VSSKIPAEDPRFPDVLAQLPHGRHGLPPEFVEHNQQERLIASFVALVDEVGYNGVSITAVADGAVVANRTFYKYYETIEDIAIATFDKGVEELRPLVLEAYRSESEWPRQIRAILAVLLASFAEYPERARFLTAEPFVAGPVLARRHRAAIEELVPFLRKGREMRSEGADLPETTERGIIGAVNSMVARRLTAGRGERLQDLLPDLTQFVLTPYVGGAEARRIAAG
jgi:AcrR family transcriptional regulator